MFSLKQKKKNESSDSLKNDVPLTRQEEIEQEEKMRVLAREKAERELKEEKQKKDNKTAGIGCLVIIGIIVIFSIFSSGGEKTPPTDWRTEDNSNMAYNMSKDFVTQRLKSPSTAKFPSVFERDGHVVKGKDHQYMINSYVDSQNSFGATIRTKFILIIEQVDKDNWKLVDIQM